MGLVAPWHVGSSQIRARTPVPCIGGRILNHCSTREVPLIISFSLPMCLSTRTVLLFLLINTLLVSLLSVFVGILFLQSCRARALSLTFGLVASIWCSHCCDPTSITGRELKPCFKLLQAEATRDQIHLVLFNSQIVLYYMLCHILSGWPKKFISVTS